MLAILGFVFTWLMVVAVLATIYGLGHLLALGLGPLGWAIVGAGLILTGVGIAISRS